ncbi:hypothetical protein K9L67_02520 [Candidatus Woesearchaeota archaeon]|nr:hypothetical protein [Candidatus Woesearchaeota archaeon]MCF7901079.1 hypothetical protein [Candidatus Woesearchaeota archaeon]MCF8013138.1 hypothetical protein [Candidatus Woesearchaeota archaeon]
MIKEINFPFLIRRKVKIIEKKIYNKSIAIQKETRKKLQIKPNFSKDIIKITLRILKFIIKHYEKINVEPYIQYLKQYKEKHLNDIECICETYKEFKEQQKIQIILYDIKLLSNKPSKEELIFLQEKIIKKIKTI